MRGTIRRRYRQWPWKDFHFAREAKNFLIKAFQFSLLLVIGRLVFRKLLQYSHLGVLPRMSIPFPRLPWWLLGGGKNNEAVPKGSSLNPSTDAFKFSPKISPTKRKVKRRWLSKEEKRNDGDPSDGICSPECETVGPEWSMGWMEPHGPDFQSNDEGDGGFVVLVPCYRGVAEGSSNQLLSAIKNLSNGFSPDGKNYMEPFMEQWLSSLQNF